MIPNMGVLHHQQPATEVGMNGVRQIMNVIPVLRSYKTVGNLSPEAVKYIREVALSSGQNETEVMYCFSTHQMAMQKTKNCARPAYQG